MLFDLEADPHELTNLCLDPAHQALAAEMEGVILSRWDPVALKADVIASQQRRHFVQRVILTGEPTPWDFQPQKDASKQYLRTGGSPTHVKGLGPLSLRRAQAARQATPELGSRDQRAALAPIACNIAQGVVEPVDQDLAML